MAHPGPDAGVVAGVPASFATLVTMCAFLAIAFYNMLELIVIILTTFKSRSGLYFWSFVAATFGIAPYGVGFTLRYFGVMTIKGIPVVMIAGGLICFITGQSLVLYSRLHLIVRNTRVLHGVLIMIIFNTIVFHGSTLILAFGINCGDTKRFLPYFLIFDNIQLAVSFVQEFIISSIYIYSAVRLLAPAGEPISKPLRNLFIHLIVVNIFVLVLDCLILGLGYSGNFQIQTTFKAAVYSVKLKVEFSVLNRLVGIVKNKNLTGGELSPGSGTGWRLKSEQESGNSKVLASVGSGSTDVTHGEPFGVDTISNLPKENELPRVAARETNNKDQSDMV
ncbi:hypothetical protein ONS95_013608 [Cadophora gregata]|uniref:uncharacterized protein n=1 Tax=Cadophora gregata TaxID=51156 RepID=UPI0026DA97BB|nr:uncharacterized protein ONS95_013608 [Cadophora gregata]KAK0113354.1 hypothetical protein ONS96_014219 [Cadophora gregata f. sp. sojae]KAK0114104.1 hypothetical protein ONS95_013608 [Cadophora gregata]